MVYRLFSWCKAQRWLVGLVFSVCIKCNNKGILLPIGKGDSFMSKRKKEIEENEQLKYEIAEELGLLDKVLKEGWKSLTAKETGRIGGLVTKKRRERKVTEK